MKKIQKTIFWCFILIGVGVMIFIGMKPKPVGVDIAEVTTGLLQVTVDEDGETMIRDPYIISAPLSGKLLRLETEPGDAIAKDTLLAVIDPGEPNLLDARSEAEANARVNAAGANVKRIESEVGALGAELERWQRYCERDEGRLSKGLIAAPTLEDTRHALRMARSNFEAGESGLAVSRFELEQAKAVLLRSQSPDDANGDDRHFEIHSPITGVILRRFKESSTVIPAGEPIMEIGNPEDLEIRIDVLSQDAVKIKPGQRVIIEHWGGEKDLTAHVRRVEPSAFTKISALGVDEQRVYVYADFSKEETETANLGDAYRIEARIVVWEEENALRIPSGAIFRNDGFWSVYVVADNRAELRKVDIGKNNGIEAEVLSGLKAGDRVVLHPGDRVEPGILLEAREG